MRLRIKFNHAFIVLSQDTMGRTIGYLESSKEIQRASWLGFIDRSTASRLPGARPVKLIVFQYSESHELFRWSDLQEGEYIQGCLVTGGVMAVTHCVPRIVKGRVIGPQDTVACPVVEVGRNRSGNLN